MSTDAFGDNGECHCSSFRMAGLQQRSLVAAGDSSTYKQASMKRPKTPSDPSARPSRPASRRGRWNVLNLGRYLLALVLGATGGYVFLLMEIPLAVDVGGE